MCGIAGIFSCGGLEEESALRQVASMAGAVAHRGPDDCGSWLDAAAGIALAHRRLSIIDLSVQGHQPMRSACGRYAVILNGEIYNFRELRTELERAGHGFRGHSDTEVLLAAVVEWGLRPAVERCNGMFAFALWDAQARALSLVRDRVGEKPLYYYRGARVLLFASELKALCAHPEFRPTLDRGAVAQYFRFGYVGAPRTPLQATFKVLPGTILSFRAAAGEVAAPVVEPYWSATSVFTQALGRRARTATSGAQELEALLRDAVRMRMIADVPIGAFLSGGIDSSLIVALMQAQSTRRVRSFTVRFDETRYDESQFARAVAEHLGTDHTELRVTPRDALSLVPRLAAICDEPMADASQIPTALIAALTRRHVTVSLSGDAGDELFGGYDRYTQAARLLQRVSRWPYALRALAGAALGATAGISRLPGLRGATVFRHAHKLRRLITARDPAELYALYVSRWQDGAVAGEGAGTDGRMLAAGLGAIPDATFEDQMMLLDFLVYLPDDILIKVDRASMAVGLETRVPFLDPRVIELAWSLPQHLKISPQGGKRVLRQILGKYVPPRLFERPKMGFGVPLAAWLRGPLREWAEDLLSEAEVRRAGVLDPRAVRATWRAHLSARADRSSHLWDVLVFQGWLRELRPSLA
jgi:asparagine synthase (glutamine-hydrolysing)